MYRYFGTALLLLLAMGIQAAAAEPTLTAEGIKMPLKGIGDLTFTYPDMQDSSGKSLSKIFDKKIEENGRRAVVKYEGGHEIVFVKKDGGRIEMSYKNPPAGLHCFRTECLVPFAMNEGGKYRFGDSAEKPFPMQKPEKPHLFQGNTQTCRLTAPNGESFELSGLEQGAFFQLQDNREWNWSIFAVSLLCPYNSDHEKVDLRFTSGKDASAVVTKMVDRFGQDFTRDFPGKIRSEDELKKDIETEKEFYAAFPKAKDLDLDVYGGYEGTGKLLGLKKTGFFHAQKASIKADGKSYEQWFLVDPAGNAFFHRGICGFGPSDDFTYTEGRENIFEWLPPHDNTFGTAWHPESWWNPRAVSFYVANLIRKYDKPFERNEWAARMIDRVRTLGFTSGGAFGNIPTVFAEKNFPHVRSFGFWGLGYDIPGARGFFDPFDPALIKKIDENFAKSIPQHVDDPLLIGYYLANEQGVEDLPRALPALDEKFATKKELVAFLKKRYENIAAFNTAWGMKAGSFDELLNQGLPVSTREASTDITAFVEVFLDKYYSLLSELFHKYDNNHLLIGSRWQPGTANNEALVRICAKYNDVISVNYYTVAFDQTFLDRIYRWSGEKPMLLSEWHYTCIPESALPGGLGSVNTQKERGLAYRNYVEQAAATGYVVGTEWFTLIDQARAGRFFEMNTGEKANTGLFAVTDRPWKDFVTEAAKTNATLKEVLFHKRAAFRFDDPRFVPKSQGKSGQAISAPWVDKPIKIDGSRDGWPGQPPILLSENRLILGTDSNGMSAAFRAAWDEKNLYVFVDVTDPTPGKNELKGADLWQGDGVELFLGAEDLDKTGGLIYSDRQVLIGAGSGAAGSGESQTYIRNAPSGKTTPITRSVALKPDGKGYFLEVAIPFAALGWTVKEGQELLFDLALDDSVSGKERARQFVWNSDARVSNDRGSWGRLRLTK